MVQQPPRPSEEYWDAVDEAMLRLFFMDSIDAGIEAALMAKAQAAGTAPEDFAHQFGEQHGLGKREYS